MDPMSPPPIGSRREIRAAVDQSRDPERVADDVGGDLRRFSLRKDADDAGPSSLPDAEPTCPWPVALEGRSMTA
jgi:hypothetical protein